MVRKDEIIEGRYLRTLSDSFSVPVSTIAKVDTVGTTWQGEFAFTVRWHDLNPGTQVRPLSDRSLNLSEQDLAHFEAVSNEEGGRAVRVRPLLHRQPEFKLSVGGYRRTKKSKLLDPRQLSLFTSEDA
jgi:hypothetical protein